MENLGFSETKSPSESSPNVLNNDVSENNSSVLTDSVVSLKSDPVVKTKYRIIFALIALFLLILLGWVYLFLSSKKGRYVDSSIGGVSNLSTPPATTEAGEVEKFVVEEKPQSEIGFPNEGGVAKKSEETLYIVNVLKYRPNKDLPVSIPDYDLLSSLYNFIDLPSYYDSIGFDYYVIGFNERKISRHMARQIDFADSNFDIFDNLYFLAEGFSIDTSKTYQDKYFSVRFEKADQRLIPFVKDQYYCEKDNDCFLSTRSYNASCYKGVINKFDTFPGAVDCTPGVGEGGCLEKMVDFDKISCVNNRCEGIGEKYYIYNHCEGRVEE